MVDNSKSQVDFDVKCSCLEIYPFGQLVSPTALMNKVCHMISDYFDKCPCLETSSRVNVCQFTALIAKLCQTISDYFDKCSCLETCSYVEYIHVFINIWLL